MNKRIYLFLGHYGSGKTNIAANFALRLREQGYSVGAVDLDIVNPYFRLADWSGEFSTAGIELVSPLYANTNLDIPALSSSVYGMLQRRDQKLIMDIGGDDAGAVAVGQYAKMILEENDYEALYVVNFMRPMTRSAEEALTVLREIESVTGIPFTGIVNNTNLGRESTVAILDEGVRLSADLAALASIPLLYSVIDEVLAAEQRMQCADKYGKYGIFRINTKRFC